MATETASDTDVVVVGAGFAGLYMLHRLRGLGLSARCLEAGEDVGGTWYWNRYPGARCDIQSIDYSYSFDAELETEWQWSEKYATQPEILRYLEHVVDKHDLRRDIEFSTRVQGARWDEAAKRWRLQTDDTNGQRAGEVTCRYYVMATGCLSVPKNLDIAGVDSFGGDVYYTSSWPHDGVDFTGKRVGVIGTGSSGIQSIPLIAQEAAEMTVFQRTPNFSAPAHNGPIPAQKLAAIEGRHAEYREEARWSRGGVPDEATDVMTLAVTEEQRQQRYEEAWAAGELAAVLGVYADLLISEEANEHFAEFIRNKIRQTVNDPATAELLCPTNHPFGTKRPCLDTNYYETYNLAHVSLVDLHQDPIETVTETGLKTEHLTFEFDAIVFATGFDAMTGAIVAVDIVGKDGVTLKDKWSDGPTTYLGLMTTGFPNLFLVTGPGSPSVLSNMMVSIEQHVDWIADCIADLQGQGLDQIEPTETAEAGWQQHVVDCGDITLYPKANSWYMGANVPGKPRVFLPYVGGVDAYRQACNDVVEQDYLGFALAGPAVERCNDGVIRQVQPDVAMVLDMIASMELPPMESMSPEGAREFAIASGAASPPGPEVGEVVDGVFPGADGADLDYRLYRPATPGPHPVVVYFHGGGWVIGNVTSDDALCRDLCVSSDSIIISCDYRHAPEARFPAAVDDGYAAVQWFGDKAESLGGRPDELAVAGWSAGANIAAVACQTARDSAGPAIAGQLLMTPVTDCDMSRSSYVENADGYVLTAALMRWFWDHYADKADRTNPKASPLLADDLSNLPPAAVVTCDFDPLRDEGLAYAAALQAAGVAVTPIRGRGHIHTSLSAVGVVISGAPVRAEIATALRSFFKAPVTV